MSLFTNFFSVEQSLSIADVYSKGMAKSVARFFVASNALHICVRTGPRVSELRLDTPQLLPYSRVIPLQVGL